MTHKKGNMLIAQGGGPTAVINQSLVGAILEARKFDEIAQIYGALNGVNGIINEKFVDLTLESEENLKKVAEAPASALLSTRDKPDKEYCEKIYEVLKAHNIKYFFYIGGNDSSDTLRILNEFFKGEDFNCVHIPKTVDNDLVLNDHTPGYPSAARFVAEAFAGLDLDNRSLPGVYIAVIMGRHAGFLTAASAMAKRYEDDGPHLIYLPEKVFSREKFLKDVQKIYSKYKRCVVAVSEGIQNAEGTPVAVEGFSKVEKDAHGNVQLSGSGSLADTLKDLIKNNTEIKRVRADTFGYLQRSFRNCVSEVDRIEAREVGAKAVQFAVENKNGSVTINRVSENGEYKSKYDLVELKEVAGKTKTMPDKFINNEANYVTEEFINYIKPLLGESFKGGGVRLFAPYI